MSSSVSLPRIARPRLSALQAIQAATSLIVLVSLIFLLRLGANPEIAFVFAGAFAIHAGSRPSQRELGLALSLAAAFSALYLSLGAQVDTFWVSRVAGLAAALGCGSLAVLCLRVFTEKEEASRTARATLKAASIIPIFAMVASVGMNFVHNFPERTFDLYLYKFDSSLVVQASFQASFLAGRLFADAPRLRDFAALIYDALPLLPALVFGIALHGNRKLPFNPLTSFVVAGVVCFCLYPVCPGTSPSAVFAANYPQLPPDASLLTLQPIAVLNSPRNAMPSMHAAWTLLAWWCSFQLRPWLRIFCTAFLGMTLLATLGLGEHYLIDLIVAFSFSVAISAFCCRELAWATAERWQAMAAGGGTTLVWLLLLRTGSLSSLPTAAAWIAVAAAISISTVAQIRLLRAHAQAPSLPALL
jgi:hypothetical protein